MNRILGVLLVGIALAGRAVPVASAIDLEQPQFKAPTPETPLVKPAAQEVPMTKVPLPPIPPKAPAAEKIPAPATVSQAPVEVQEPIVESADCADGKCAAKFKGKDGEGHLGKFWGWLTYKSPKGNCDCRQPTPYHPPLYMYFGGCREASCRSGCLPPPVVAVTPAAAVAKRTEEPLRMPEMPKLAGPVNPVVPGSSTALSEKREGGAVLPLNYKAMPVMPAVPPSK